MDLTKIIFDYVESRGVKTPQDLKERSEDLIDLISIILLQNKVLQEEFKNE